MSFVTKSKPLLPLIAMLGLLIWGVGAAPFFLFSSELRADVSSLGAGIVSGGVIALAVAILDESTKKDAQERERLLRDQMERRQLALSLSLQSDLSQIS